MKDPVSSLRLKIMSARLEDRVGEVILIVHDIDPGPMLHLLHGPGYEVQPEGIPAVKNGCPGDCIISPGLLYGQSRRQACSLHSS